MYSINSESLPGIVRDAAYLARQLRAPRRVRSTVDGEPATANAA
jgi:hypothetical protein